MPLPHRRGRCPQSAHPTQPTGPDYDLRLRCNRPAHQRHRYPGRHAHLDVRRGGEASSRGGGAGTIMVGYGKPLGDAPSSAATGHPDTTHAYDANPRLTGIQSAWVLLIGQSRIPSRRRNNHKVHLKFIRSHMWDNKNAGGRMLKKVTQQGRSDRENDTYPSGTWSLRATRARRWRTFSASY